MTKLELAQDKALKPDWLRMRLRERQGLAYRQHQSQTDEVLTLTSGESSIVWMMTRPGLFYLMSWS